MKRILILGLVYIEVSLLKDSAKSRPEFNRPPAPDCVNSTHVRNHRPQALNKLTKPESRGKPCQDLSLNGALGKRVPIRKQTNTLGRFPTQ